MDQVVQQTSGKHRFIECLGTEYAVLGTYVDWHTKVRLRHTQCGFEQAVLAENWEGRYTPTVKFCGMRECFPSDVTSKIQEKLNAKQLP